MKVLGCVPEYGFGVLIEKGGIGNVYAQIETKKK